jgi:hypothetical protein
MRKENSVEEDHNDPLKRTFFSKFTSPEHNFPVPLRLIINISNQRHRKHMGEACGRSTHTGSQCA